MPGSISSINCAAGLPLPLRIAAHAAVPVLHLFFGGGGAPPTVVGRSNVRPPALDCHPQTGSSKNMTRGEGTAALEGDLSALSSRRIHKPSGLSNTAPWELADASLHHRCQQGCPYGGGGVHNANRNERSRGDALCFMVKTWARHKTTETVLNNGWRLAVGGWRLAVGGWRLTVGGWWSLGACP